MAPLNALFAIAGLHPESGGPSRSVSLLSEALARQTVCVEIVAHHYGPSLALPLMPRAAGVQTTFVDCSSPFCRRMQWTHRFRPVLRERCRAFQPHVVHDTGLWLSTNYASAVVCNELRLPRIVSPRGMLTSWALHHKGWKKKLAWTLYQSRAIRSAALLHATSPAEADTFRNVGLKQPVAMIPNGVELPSPSERVPGSPTVGRRTALFLGRIHPVKGLPNLIHAWQRVRPAGWQLLLVGSEELGHLRELRRIIGECALDLEVLIRPAVEDREKWQLYSDADLFVLPSHSENFGMVVAEAMGAGLPVIATRGTPWPELATRNCGWWVEFGIEPLAAALEEATRLSDGERRAMGHNGRALVKEKYTWEAAANQMHAAYQWLCHRQGRPPCIMTL